MDINWGIFSTGNIAAKFAEEYAYVNDGQILAVASRTEDKARDFAERYNIKKAYEGYENLAKDPDIDAIYIATPHSHHYENTLLALKNNKAVLCEKPAAVNSEQLNQMLELAKERNVLFMEAMWTYFLPPILQAKEWIENGEIGDVQRIMADFGISIDFDPEHRAYNPHLAGGSLLDLGIYPLSLATYLNSSDVKTIQSAATFGKTQVDNYTSALVKFNNGALLQAGCSFLHHSMHDAWIQGSAGYIHIPNFWRAAKAYMKNSQKSLLFEDTRAATGYNYEIEEMNYLIKNNKKQSDVVTFQRSKTNMYLLDTIRKQIGLTYPME